MPRANSALDVVGNPAPEDGPDHSRYRVEAHHEANSEVAHSTAELVVARHHVHHRPWHGSEGALDHQDRHGWHPQESTKNAQLLAHRLQRRLATVVALRWAL